MGISKYIWIILGLVLFLSTARAEQDLPITIVDGETVYRSRLNYVEALDKITNKVIWETVVYEDIEPKFYIPGLEQDVQWNVIKELKLEGDVIRAIDSKRRVYLLNKITGKIIDQ